VLDDVLKVFRCQARKVDQLVWARAYSRSASFQTKRCEHFDGRKDFVICGCAVHIEVALRTHSLDELPLPQNLAVEKYIYILLQQFFSNASWQLRKFFEGICHSFETLSSEFIYLQGIIMKIYQAEHGKRFEWRLDKYKVLTTSQLE